MKKKLLYIIEILVLAISVIFLVAKSESVLQWKEPVTRDLPFIELETEYDVLFFGSSHMMNTMLPLELWRDYGITSYNLGISREQFPTTYWTMENAITYKQPKIVVVDMFTVYDNLMYDEIPHRSWDIYPLSKVKWEGVNDIIEDKNIQEELLFPFGFYHTRWNELDKNDFITPITKEMGAIEFSNGSSTRLTPMENAFTLTLEKKELQEGIVGICYLRRMIESCQKKGIEIVLVHNPWISSPESQMWRNAIEDIAEEYDVPYLNFVRMNNVVDMKTDFYDIGHLNRSGSEKVTDYFGDWLVKHYPIQDKREDESYAELWDAFYEDYLVNEKLETMKNLDAIYGQLLVMHDDEFNYCIYVNGDTTLYGDETFLDLMQNITREHIYEDSAPGLKSGDIRPLKRLEEAVENGEDYYLMVDNASGETVEAVSDEIVGEQDSKFIDLLDEDTDIQVFIMDKETGEILTTEKWKYQSLMFIKQEE